MLNRIFYPFKRVLYLLYKFVIYKIVFPQTYRCAAKKPVDPCKVVFIEMHQNTLSDNFTLLFDKLNSSGNYKISCQFINNKGCGRLEQLKRSRHCIKEMATAKYIFLNTTCDVIDNTPIRKETVVTQLWHACGAFKKFGFSTSDGIFGENKSQLKKYPLHRNYSHVTVSSPSIVWAYEQAMNLPHESGIVKPTGISRTDVFFDKAFIQAALQKLHSTIPESKNKRVILYAPTFRGHIHNAYAPDKLDISIMHQKLADDYILLIKNHPFIKKKLDIPEQYQNFCFDVSDCLNIDVLLCTADICISDYSSIVFEYSLFERPMIFFPYDIEEYNDWRGFYYDYNALTPGECFYTTEDIADYIKNIDSDFNPEPIIAFKNKFMSSCDGNATNRIIDLVFN